MPLIILAALTFIGAALFGGISGQTGNPLIPENQPGGERGPACLDESMFGEVALTAIPNANDTNSPFPRIPGPINCRDATGSCPDPNGVSDYLTIQGAENVVIEKVWPDDRTTRLAKIYLPISGQPNYRPEFESLRDLVYRASCNDWCDSRINLPYGGTFHCDFLFLFKPKNPEVGNSDDWVKRSNDEWYPRNGSMFQILFRNGGKIPDYAGQDNLGGRTPVRCDLITPTPVAGKINGNDLARAILQPVMAQFNQDAINVNGVDYLFKEELKIYRYHLRSKTAGRVRLPDATFRNETYEVYKNISVKYEPTDDILYLAKPGKIAEADQLVDPLFLIDLYEFRRITDVKPRSRSLQLGTFKPYFGTGWWKKWVDESKPAIYLYPEKDTIVSVHLTTRGEITVSDPYYDPQTGWQDVLTHPDGTLTYQGKNYPHLFYEALLSDVLIQPQGSLVEGYNLESFFREILPKLGLEGREKDEFIDYWMKRLSTDQPYYFIHWLSEEQIAWLEPVDISLKPDTEIRIRAYFKPLAAPVSVIPQELPTPLKRQGFTLVEWGGILDQ